MKTLEDYKREEELGITRKDTSRYFEVTFAAMIIAAAVQGFTGDWRLGFPCLMVGIYWFATNNHDKKIIVSMAVYAVITTILIYYFDKGPEHPSDCSQADDYFCCLAENNISRNALGIMTLTWFFGIFIVSMSKLHKKVLK